MLSPREQTQHKPCAKASVSPGRICVAAGRTLVWSHLILPQLAIEGHDGPYEDESYARTDSFASGFISKGPIVCVSHADAAIFLKVLLYASSEPSLTSAPLPLLCQASTPLSSCLVSLRLPSVAMACSCVYHPHSGTAVVRPPTHGMTSTLDQRTSQISYLFLANSLLVPAPLSVSALNVGFCTHEPHGMW